MLPSSLHLRAWLGMGLSIFFFFFRGASSLVYSYLSTSRQDECSPQASKPKPGSREAGWANILCKNITLKAMRPCSSQCIRMSCLRIWSDILCIRLSLIIDIWSVFMIKNHRDMWIPSQQEMHWTHLLSLLPNEGIYSAQMIWCQLPQAPARLVET